MRVRGAHEVIQPLIYAESGSARLYVELECEKENVTRICESHKFDGSFNKISSRTILMGCIKFVYTKNYHLKIKRYVHSYNNTYKP